MTDTSKYKVYQGILDTVKEEYMKALILRPVIKKRDSIEENINTGYYGAKKYEHVRLDWKVQPFHDIAKNAEQMILKNGVNSILDAAEKLGEVKKYLVDLNNEFNKIPQNDDKFSDDVEKELMMNDLDEPFNDITKQKIWSFITNNSSGLHEQYNMACDLTDIINSIQER